MNLPPEIQPLLAPVSAGTPRMVVRSASDLEGNLGETYVAVDPSNLFLFSRRPGEPFRSVQLTLRDIDDLSLVPEGLYTNLEITARSQHLALRFPSWDQPELKRVVECWQQTSGRTSRLGGEGDAGMLSATGVINSTVAVSPRVVLAASLRAMAEADGDPDDVERAEIARVLGDATAPDEGASFLVQNRVEGLLASLIPVLNPAQRRCLMANLLGVAMADGLLRTTEQALLDRFQKALAMPDAEFQRLCDVLLAKHNLAVFAEEPAPSALRIEPVPLTIFCAALLALIEADGVAADEEREAQQRLLDDSSAWEAGQTLLAERGLEGVLANLNRLNRAQQRCLLVNLMGMGLCDGWLRTSEQELIDRFRQAMSFSVEEHDAIFQVLLNKEELSVFQ